MQPQAGAARTTRGANRIKRIEECVRDARAGHYRLQLLSGHIGSGKTTELRWLAGELQKAKEERVVHALFLDVEQYLDARDIQIPELLTAEDAGGGGPADVPIFWNAVRRQGPSGAPSARSARPRGLLSRPI